MDSVLTNLNRLNRSLEAIIAVGNEFGSVEALWSTFEGVMGNQQSGVETAKQGEDDAGSGAGEEKDT
jgi:DASH complex subunit DAD1